MKKWQKSLFSASVITYTSHLTPICYHAGCQESLKNIPLNRYEVDFIIMSIIKQITEKMNFFTLH